MTEPGGVDLARQLLEDAVAHRLFPAAVAELGTSEVALWQQAFGALTFDAHSPAASLETSFDLASLTKPRSSFVSRTAGQPPEKTRSK